MKWFGIVALLFLLFVLAGFVYIGANTDKLGFGFGEPSKISEQFTAPSNNLPSFSIPGFSGFVSGGVNFDKIQTDLEKKLMNTKSEQEITQIIEDTLRPILSDPGMEVECKRVMKELENEQVKMSNWVTSGKDVYSYPIEHTQQLTKEMQICVLAQNEGYINLTS